MGGIGDEASGETEPEADRVPVACGQGERRHHEQVASVKANAVYNIVLTASAVVFPLITYPYVSRILMPSSLGVVAFFTAVMYYFNAFAQLGIPTYGIRACAAVRDNREALSRTTQELMIINLSTTVVSYGALVAAFFLVPQFRAQPTLLFVMSIGTVLNAIGMEWLYRALEQFSYIAIRSVVFKALAVVLMVLLIHSPKDYVTYGALTVLAASASNVLNFINARKHVSMRAAGPYEVKRHFRPILVFFAMSVVTTFYTRLDATMLGFMSTPASVGYADAVSKVRSVLISVITSVSSVLLPRAAYYIGQDRREDFSRIVRKGFDFVVLVGVPLAALTAFYARPIILVLAGVAFTGAIVPLKLVAPTILFIGITNLFGIQILVPLRRERQVLISEGCAAVVAFGINLLLIPRMDVRGTSLGSLCAEGTVLIVQVVFLRSTVLTVFRRAPWAIAAIGTVGGLSLAYVVARPINNSVIQLVVGVMIFSLSYGGWLLWRRERLAVDAWSTVFGHSRRRNSAIEEEGNCER